MAQDLHLGSHTDAGLVDADPYYIRTPSPPTDEVHLVLKDGDSFVVLDRHGDIRPIAQNKAGLYHEGTRFLSALGVRFGPKRPLLLEAVTRDDNAAIMIDLTNPDLTSNGTIVVPRGTLHLSRLLVLSHGVLHDRIRLRNYGLEAVSVPLDIDFDADFLDLFQVRGTPRPRHGERLPAALEGDGVVLGYRGLDGVIRRTRIRLHAAGAQVTARQVHIDCELPPHGDQEISFAVSCENGAPAVRLDFPAACQVVTDALERRRADYAGIVTSNQQFNAWLRRSVADLSMMTTDTPHGEYPYAGVPWFSTPFGRDGLITAFECLWVNPSLARGVLSFLAATQATTAEPARDAQPGKILHEMRSGEMAALGEIPFGRYYGSHDATPLFVMLAAAYFERTDDRALIERIWPSIEAALHWIEHDGDLDGDGFVEYARQSPSGLAHQGWKDSHDSVFHAGGELAAGPVALAEVQAYVYAAWRGAAALVTALGHPERARQYAKRAEALRERFDSAFWSDEIGTYVLALDGRKRPCAVRTSNAGHALFAGIALPQRAVAVARSLMSPEAFSGWGIRTVSIGEMRYNPMSYHNGSIWPHDNALIAAGLVRYGLHDEALAVLSGLFETTLHMDLHRLPELFCGFARGRDEAPVSYPVACSPQAWASAAVFLLLQSALGLEINAATRVVTLTRPALPAFLQEVSIDNLRVGPYSLDLLLERHEHNVGINVLRRTGNVDIVAIK